MAWLNPSRCRLLPDVAHFWTTGPEHQEVLKPAASRYLPLHVSALNSLTAAASPPPAENVEADSRSNQRDLIIVHLVWCRAEFNQEQSCDWPLTPTLKCEPETCRILLVLCGQTEITGSNKHLIKTIFHREKRNLMKMAENVFWTGHKEMVCLYHLSVRSEQLHVINILQQNHNKLLHGCISAQQQATKHVREVSDSILNSRPFVHIFSPFLLLSCFNLFQVFIVSVLYKRFWSVAVFGFASFSWALRWLGNSPVKSTCSLLRVGSGKGTLSPFSRAIKATV